MKKIALALALFVAGSSLAVGLPPTLTPVLAKSASRGLRGTRWRASTVI